MEQRDTINRLFAAGDLEQAETLAWINSDPRLPQIAAALSDQGQVESMEELVKDQADEIHALTECATELGKHLTKLLASPGRIPAEHTLSVKQSLDRAESLGLPIR